MKVAVIHARGGSKRIPKKNIKDFCGAPMISYPIKVALESKIFDRVVVSTDCEEIAKVARDFGAEVPYMRPDHLADDMSTTQDALLHDVQALGVPDYLCCIYATAPFLKAQYLEEGYKLLKNNKDVNGCFSVTTFAFPIFRSLKMDETTGELSMFWPEHQTTRSQDLPEAYHDAGQFYWVRGKEFLKEKKLYTKGGRAVILPRHLVQDIDTPEDWVMAENMFKAQQQSKQADL